MKSPLPSIAIEEVEFHSLSYEDHAGRLFWRDGGLYRGLSSSSANFYSELFQGGVIDELVKDGLLVESRLTQDTMEGYPGIAEHSVVPFVSFAHEWSPEMLRSAGRLVLDLATRLHSCGLELADGHAWNVLFQGPRPIFVDLGAIQAASDETRWAAADQFRAHFLNPLYLASAGAEDIARSLMQTAFNGGIPNHHLKYFSTSEKLVQRTRARAANLARRVLPPHIQDALRKKLPRHRSPGSQATHLESLKEELASIALPQPATNWSVYYGEDFSPWEQNPEGNAKLSCVLEILSRMRPASVLDVGANRGWYALAAAKRGASVVAIDTDSTCISRLYSDALAQSLPVLPLIMDFRNPSPARGLCGELCPAAWDRIGCDLVLALAIVHHLALRHRLNFDHIIASLKRFTKRCLLVEFPMPEDYMVKELMRTGDEWYTSANFQGTLQRHFRKIERFPSNTDTRELYVCEL